MEKGDKAVQLGKRHLTRRFKKGQYTPFSYLAVFIERKPGQDDPEIAKEENRLHEEGY